MKLVNRIARNSVSIWLTTVAEMLSQFVVVPFLVHRLGPDQYGMIGVLLSITIISSLVSMGLRPAVARHLAADIARKDEEGVNQIFSSAIACFSVIGVIVVVACVVASRQIATWKGFDPEVAQQAELLIRYFVSATLLLTFLLPCYSALLTGAHRFDLWSVVKLIETAVRTAGIFLLVGLTDWGVYAWAAAALFANFVNVVLTAVAAHYVCPTLKGRLRFVRWDATKRLFSLGAYLGGNELVMVMRERVGPLILAYFLGTWAVALFTPAFLFTNGVRSIISALARQVRPMATDFYVTGKENTLRELVCRGSRSTFLVAIPFLVAFTCFGDPIVKVWLGNDALGGFVYITGWVLVIQAIVDYSFFPGQTHYRILTGIDHLRVVTMVNFVMAVVRVAASAAMVAWMSNTDFLDLDQHREFAVLGAILPCLITEPIVGATMAIIIGRAVKLSLRRFAVEAYLRPLLVAVPLTAVGLLLRIGLQPQSFIDTAACIAVTTALWAPLAWYIGVDELDRNRFAEVVAAVSRKLRTPRSA